MNPISLPDADEVSLWEPSAIQRALQRAAELHQEACSRAAQLEAENALLRQRLAAQAAQVQAHASTSSRRLDNPAPPPATLPVTASSAKQSKDALLHSLLVEVSPVLEQFRGLDVPDLGPAAATIEPVTQTALLDRSAKRRYIKRPSTPPSPCWILVTGRISSGVVADTFVEKIVDRATQAIRASAEPLKEHLKIDDVCLDRALDHLEVQIRSRPAWDGDVPRSVSATPWSLGLSRAGGPSRPGLRIVAICSYSGWTVTPSTWQKELADVPENSDLVFLFFDKSNKIQLLRHEELRRLFKTPNASYQQLGPTRSEHAFVHILKALDSRILLKLAKRTAGSLSEGSGRNGFQNRLPFGSHADWSTNFDRIEAAALPANAPAAQAAGTRSRLRNPEQRPTDGKTCPVCLQEVSEVPDADAIARCIRKHLEAGQLVGCPWDQRCNGKRIVGLGVNLNLLARHVVAHSESNRVHTSGTITQLKYRAKERARKVPAVTAQNTTEDTRPIDPFEGEEQDWASDEDEWDDSGDEFTCEERDISDAVLDCDFDQWSSDVQGLHNYQDEEGGSDIDGGVAACGLYPMDIGY